MAKIQNEDVKSEADLTGAGGAKSQLINDTKIYITGDGINKRLDEAINDGDIGAPSGYINFHPVINSLNDVSDFTVSGGVLSITTSGGEVLNEDQSLKHVATTVGETFDLDVDIPLGYRGSIVIFQAVYKSDQERTITYTVGSSVVAVTLPATGSSTGRIKQELQTKNADASLNYEIESSAADTFIIDDIIVNDDTQIGASKVSQVYNINQLGDAVTSLSPLRYNLGTATILNEGNELIEPIDDAGNGRTNFTAKVDGDFTVSVHGQMDAANSIFDIFRSSDSKFFMRSNQIAVSNKSVISTVSIPLQAGDSFYIDPVVGAFRNDSGNPIIVNILAEAKQTTAAQEQLMQENNFAARINNNGTAAISSEGADFIDSVNQTAAGLVDVDYTSLGLTVLPAVSADVVKDSAGDNTDSDIYDITLTGCKVRTSVTSTNANLDRDFILRLTKQGADYTPISRSIIASEKPTAILKDEKTAGTHGGTFTSGSYVTRELNISEGQNYFVNLSSNQFTLIPGTYLIKSEAPAIGVDRNMIKLRNITDSTDDIGGEGAFTPSGSIIQIFAKLKGIITITENKTFEIQHIGEATQATFGLGIQVSGSIVTGFPETYSSVEITKLK